VAAFFYLFLVLAVSGTVVLWKIQQLQKYLDHNYGSG
jgi:hypothetical protein